MGADLDADVMTILSDLQVLIRDLRQQMSVLIDLQSQPAIAGKPQEWYSTAEASKLLQKSEYTVRQWCNEGRINAVKREERRGGSSLWKISTEEVARYKDEGLLSLDPSRNHGRRSLTRG